jgi:SAM-dependent methyltransferase
MIRDDDRELIAAPCPLTLVLKETWMGKSLARTFMNHVVAQRVRLDGASLDIGAGDAPSYWRFATRPRVLVRIDGDRAARPTLLASLEQPLPVRSNAFDGAVAFNVFEHIYDGRQLASEIHRVLKPGGVLYCSVPFLVPIHADPHDYFRYSGAALRQLLCEAGFGAVQVWAYGGYFSVLGTHLSRLLRFRLLRVSSVAICHSLDSGLDRIWGARRNRGTYVLGYFAQASKPAS